MTRSIILGTAPGLCGDEILAQILSRQPDWAISFQDRPLLPWVKNAAGPGIRQRIERWRATRKARLIGDVASFYLPYLEEAIECEPGIRIVCLKRPVEEIVRAFCNWLDGAHPVPTDHWLKRPAAGFYHDPFWTRIFPQYDVASREEGIARYCEEYYRVAGELAGKWPENVRIFDWRSVLEREAGQREMLSFVGIPVEKQVIDVSGKEMRGEKLGGTSGPPPWPGGGGRGQNAAEGGTLHDGQNAAEGGTLHGGTSGPPPWLGGGGRGQNAAGGGTLHAGPRERGTPNDAAGGGTLHAGPRERGTPNDAAGGGSLHNALDPRRCVVLVPYNDRIVEPCEDSLRQLERRGYPVRRVVGYAAVDQARNQLATDALLHGFEETMWIDSDVAFRPEAVEALRKHNLPIVCGIYKIMADTSIRLWHGARAGMAGRMRGWTGRDMGASR